MTRWAARFCEAFQGIKLAPRVLLLQGRGYAKRFVLAPTIDRKIPAILKEGPMRDRAFRFFGESEGGYLEAAAAWTLALPS
jgi:hypothetical protein